MISLLVHLCIFLAAMVVFFDPESQRQLGEYIAIPFGLMLWQMISLFRSFESLTDTGPVATHYAFAPEGYHDEDPLRGLIPEFEMVDPSEPIAVQAQQR